MAKQFVVMRGGDSPIFIVIPTPVFIAKTRKSANAFIRGKKYPDEYYVRSVEAEP